MSHFKMRLAGVVLDIETIYDSTYERCRNYKIEEDVHADVVIAITQKDIDSERLSCDQSSDDLEFLALHRKISDVLISYDVLLIHGVAIAVNNEAFLFTAPSGAGKTTHAIKWLAYCPGAFAINGDKPFILTRARNDFSLACGSPWCGKEGMNENTAAPLKAIVMMERSEENSIHQVSFANALPTLLEQTYRPHDEVLAREVLRLLPRLGHSCEFWRFQFNNHKSDCYSIAHDALCGQYAF